MGNKKPLDGRAVTTFGEELDLFGGRLILRRIGGHTPGLSVVEVPFACGQVSVIAGDACYSPDNIVRKIPISAGTAFERLFTAWILSSLPDGAADGGSS